jgi:hypothetical protein
MKVPAPEREISEKGTRHGSREGHGLPKMKALTVGGLHLYEITTSPEGEIGSGDIKRDEA